MVSKLSICKKEIVFLTLKQLKIRIMKAIKIGLTLFAMIAMVTFSSAQTAEQKAENQARIEKIITHLELSNEQAAKARIINEKYFGLMSNAKTDEERKQLNDEADAEAKKLLTEEQYTKYRAYLTAESNPVIAPKTRPVKSSSATKN
ncbi:MAG: hypothetical protein KDD24_07110 [Flavobacteriales bacterium]|nr:hypothetical protein [Flavobacteriales bacterium]